jgi:transcriptional regulator with XRE-family HTH domain
MKGQPLSKFGKALEKAMKAEGLTDAALSKRLGWAQPQLFLLKRTRKPRAPTLAKIAKALGKPLDFEAAKMPILAKAPAGRSNVVVFLIVEVDGIETERKLLVAI